MQDSPINSGPIVVVEDDPTILHAYATILVTSGFPHVEAFPAGDAFLQFLESTEPEVVVLDLSIPGQSGQNVLKLLVDKYPALPVVIATGNGEVDVIVRCVRLGAFDYLVKPIDRQRLVTTVRRAAAYRELKRENTALAASLAGAELEDEAVFSDIVTVSPAMKALFRYVAGIAPSSQPVLITGETGVGKELFARAIHAASKRRGSMITVNAAGLDDFSFSDSLFGHRRGAFTGAVDGRRGLVAEADEGTLFLDEIGDLSLASQVKLLRLVQEGEYTSLGADLPKRAGARFVFATNHDLLEEVRQGRFRQDLFYRLATHHVRIPPLRARYEDVALLVERFLERAADDLGTSKPRPPPALFTILSSYPFPGNIRELRALVYDAVARHRGATALPLAWFESYVRSRAAPSAKAAGGEPTVRFGETLPTLDTLKGLLIEEALRRADGNKTVAAESIGISRQAINLRERRLRGSSPDLAANCVRSIVSNARRVPRRPPRRP